MGSKYCTTYLRTSTSRSTTTVAFTTFSNVVTTLPPTGTRTVGQVTATRVSFVTSSASYITRRSTYTTTSCSTYYGGPYPGGRPFGAAGPVPIGLIIFAVLAGLWALAFLGASIFVLCFSPTAKRERMRKKGQGGFGQNQLQPQQQQQQYTAVPQDPLYSQSESHYTHSPYGGIQKTLESAEQTSYVGYQNYNNVPYVPQGPNQWPAPQPGTPSAASTISGPGPGPGYIPPGAAPSMFANPGAGGTISYSISSTSPSPPPGDPHRLLYNQQNERLSAAVSLVHPQQPQQPPPPPPSELRPPSAYSTGPSYGVQQPPQLSSSSQANLAAQYRGYAEPAPETYNGRF